MDCQRVREAFVDGLTGNLTDTEREEIQAHLAGCEACGAETARLSGTWNVLGSLEVPAPDPSLVERFALRLRRAGLERWPAWRSWAAAGSLAATLAIGFAVGYAWRSVGPGGSSPAAAPRPGYMLLLRGSGSVPANDAQAAYDEYAAWAAELARDDRLVSAEELADEATWLVADATEPTARPPAHALSEPVVGFFWIRAANADSAIAQALNSPHLRRGGTIEIREIGGRP